MLIAAFIVFTTLLAIAVNNGPMVANEAPQELPALGAISGTGPLADQIRDSMFNSTVSAADVAAFANNQDLSEIDMIKFNMAASRYNMITNLTSNLVKDLTDNEKWIAARM
jgi:hypothetical protein